jgi:UDP-N-acetylglucosamine 1-carboxyvinyltransferase
MAKLLIKNDTVPYLNDGKIYLQGSKNSMLNNLCLPLYTEDECIIENVPNIMDINDNLSFLSDLGCVVKKIHKNTVSITCEKIKRVDYDQKLSIRTTGSKFFIPILVNKFNSYKTGISQGCNIGDRGFENYAKSLEPFGIEYEKSSDNTYNFHLATKIESEITLPFPSFGLTVNSILAAVASKKYFTLKNICQEAEIDNTISMFNAMGASIENKESNIYINKSNKLHGCIFRNMSDRNAAVTYAVAALMANIELVIENYDDAKMESFYRFLDDINAKYTVDEKTLVIYKSNLHLENKNKLEIKAFLYPDFHSDWQPLVSPLLATCYFNSYIEEWLFQNRLSHWRELEKLGALFQYDNSNITRFEGDSYPHAVKVFGGAELKGNNVYANDLRSAASLVLASIKAKGETIIDNIEQLDRGYESLVQDLINLGATMEYV